MASDTKPALTLEYTNPALCERCGGEIHTPERLGRPRRFCDRCRAARRAITYLNLALDVTAGYAGDGLDEARRRIHAALEELGA